MPNWCTNKLIINGTKESLLNFINAGLTAKGESEIQELSEIGQVSKMQFGCWVPMPNTFSEYDTANYPNGERINAGISVLVKGVDTEVTEENLEDIIQQYKEASKFQEENFGVVGWYDANIKYYGTKWDSGVDSMLMEDGDMIFYFDTAWSPAINWVRHLAEQFEDLEFTLEYHEPGMGFRGEYTAYMEDGCLCDDDTNWEMTEEDFVELGYWDEDSDCGDSEE